MAHDISRAVPQPTTEPAAQDVSLPTPRQSLEPSTHDIAQFAPTGHDAPRAVPRPAQGSRAGWVVTVVAAAGAAWAIGWVAGVSWAWREMTPNYLRHHRRRRAGLSGI